VSRIGKKSVKIPDNVKIEFCENNYLLIKGNIGFLKVAIIDGFSVTQHDDSLVVMCEGDEHSKKQKALWGLLRTSINNAIVGVSVGYSVVLKVVGVGYRASKVGNKLVLSSCFQ
jgi:large subunit ribosomal protein L6